MMDRRVLDTNYQRHLVSRWSEVIEGIKTRTGREPSFWTKFITAQVLENQLQYFKNKKKSMTTLMEGEGGTFGYNYPEFVKMVLGIFRRVYPSLIAPEIVSVQPMTAPIGAVFFREVKADVDKSPVGQDDVLLKDFSPWFTSDWIKGRSIGTGDGNAVTFSATLDWTPVRPSTLAVYATIGGNPTSGADDGNGNIVGDQIDSGSINYATGAISVTFKSAPNNNTPITVDYKYVMEGNKKRPAIRYDISMEEVRVEDRSLKIIWTPEAAEDMMAYWGLDIESEFIEDAANQLSLEIDREIIEHLLVAAAASGISVVWDATVPSGITQHDHFRTLTTAISKVANTIHKRNKRGPANFIIVPPDIAVVFQQLSTHGDYQPFFWSPETETPEKFQSGVVTPTSFTPTTGTFGIWKIGTLQNKWLVYQDPYLASNTILVGFKGPSFLDAGFAHLPYVPVTSIETFIDPDDGKAKKLFRSRYANKRLRDYYYGTVTVQNL